MKDGRDAGKERRRYPRIFVQGAEGFRNLNGAQAEWPGGAVTDVLDLSYTGAALMQASGIHIEKGQTLALKIQLAGQQPVVAEARIIRADGRLAAIQFGELSASARLAFEKFLNDNLLGLNLRPVSSSYFTQSQDFNQWLHGPKDTNVFLWTKGESLEKAIVELDNQILVWQSGKLSQGKSRSNLLSAIEDYYSPVLYESVRAGIDPDQQLVARVTKILSQVPEPSAAVKQLLGKLQETGRA